MKSSIRVGKRAFFAAFFIILGLMILSGVLTRIVPAGNYEREIVDGRERVVPGSYQEVEKPDYPVWRWFTAPAEVPFSEAGLTIGTIIVFLIFVGGSFTILEEGGILRRMMEIIVRRFINRKYLLMAIVMFFFMFVASVLGIYEGMVPLVIFVVPLALSLGWDSMTGLGMSLLPLSFGFAAAITNPFTIGVAQSIAELPLFSGAWLRIIFFAVIYFLLLLFVRRYARKVEADPARSPVYREDLAIRKEGAETVEISETEDVSGIPVKPVGSGMRKAIIWFAGAMLLAIIFILVTGRIASLSRYAFPAMSVLFFIGGIGAGLFAGMGVGRVFSTFGRGGLRILPAVLIILMAYSVKLIIDNGGITDTILYQAGQAITGSGTYVSAVMIYLVTLGMNFFIGSASAKAFLMMPILTPLADLVDVTRQTAVLAFDFGDGFSNMIYPSNPLLLIALGLTVVSYPKWLKWTAALQGVVFLITLIFLWIAVMVGYGPA